MKTAINIFILAGIITVIGTCFSAKTFAADFKIIVQESNPEKEITTSQLEQYFLKKSTTWSNGMKIIPVDQVDSAAVTSSFAKDVLGKSVASISAYWQQRIFTGRAVPPLKMRTDNDVIGYVKENAGAIGYVSSSADTDGVKVLRVK